MLRHLAHARQLVHEPGHTAHAGHLRQLITEIRQIEILALLDLFDQQLRLLVVDLALHLLDQGQDIPHAQDARGDAIGMKRLQGRRLLANTQELDGLARDEADGQGGAATGIAIGLGEDDARERQGGIEGLGGIGRVLAGHGVHDKEGLDGLDRRMQTLDLRHHVLIDMQPPRGIDDEDILKVFAGRIQGRPGDMHRILVTLAGEEFRPHLRRQRPQLVDGRRTIDVATDHHDLLFLLLLEPAGKLGHTGGLARTLQARHQHHRRRLRRQVQDLVGRTHELDQLVVDDLDQHLARRQAARHLLAHRLVAYPVHKGSHHRQGHIGLEQGHAHLAQGVLNVVLGQATPATEIVEGASEALLQIFEHGLPRTGKKSGNGPARPVGGITSPV